MFNKNFNLTVDEFLTPEECNSIIEKYNTMLTSGEDAHLNYEKCDIENDENLIAILNKRLPIVTDKKYNPGKSYDRWHSEHSLRNPHRILNIIVYLSDHNCGTKFYNGETIFSKTGRLTIFPSYFTHTHKGEVCPENKPRYILAGYYNFKQ